MPPDRRIRSSASIQQRSRELRRSMTLAEQKLWQRLRSRKLDGLKFRRQHPIGRFIVDFYCAEHKLVVEVDGAIHIQQAGLDQERTLVLEDNGYRVLRFQNQQVENDIETVLASILKACQLDH